jgi:hypothetical protein
MLDEMKARKKQEEQLNMETHKHTPKGERRSRLKTQERMIETKREK